MIKWIGQHIWDFVSRFRNDVYLESVSTDTIVSGGNLGLDSNNKIVKATVSGGATISNDGNDRITTALGNGTLYAEPNLTWNNLQLGLEYSGSSGPVLLLTKTGDNDTGPTINLASQRAASGGAAGVDGDDLGQLQFFGYNNASPNPEAITFGKILCEIEERDDGDEAGKLSLTVATSNGSTSALQNAFTATGQATHNYISTTIGYGTASVATIAGDAFVNSNIQLGHASDTTIARSASGTVTIEGNEIITTATQGIVRNVTTTINEAAMDDLHSNAVELVANPGSGKWVCPIDQWLVVDRGGTNNNSVNLHTSWNSATSLTTSPYFYKRFFYNEAADVFYRMVRYGADYGNLDPSNKNLTIKLDGAIDAGSITSMKVYTQYMILDY